MNKRAVIFSFMALLAIGLLFLLLRPEQSELNLDRALVSRTRIQTADTYVLALRENYLPSATQVATYRSLNSLSRYVGVRGFFSSRAEFERAFKEVFLNGTIRQGAGAPAPIENVIGPGVYGTNFTNLLREVSNASEQFIFTRTNFTLNYNDIGVVIYQTNLTGPWQLGVNLTLNYTVDTGEAKWKRNDTIVVLVVVEGLDDPLYRGNTGGVRFNNVRQTNISSWNLQSFRRFVNYSEYTFEGTAPSYLQRFYGDTSASSGACCGIESFVRRDVAMNLSQPERSFVDCAFFGGSCVSALGSPLNSLWNVTDITDSGYRFKIDQYRAFARYNLSNDAYP